MLEHHQKETVELVAVAAPLLVHPLADQIGRIKGDGLSQEKREIFKRDVRHLGTMQEAERLHAGRERAIITDAFQVGVQTKRADRHNEYSFSQVKAHCCVSTFEQKCTTEG